MDSTETNGRDSLGKRRKELFKEILLKRDFITLARWVQEEQASVRTLSSLLYDPDKRVCWRAVEALGRVAAIEVERDPEKVRELLRRLFWQLNDESGNLGWYAPQAIAEILAKVPSLIGEYTRILVSFLPEEPFEIGVRWGLARIAEVDEKALTETAAGELLIRSLTNPDKDIIGFTLFCLKAIRVKFEPEAITPFQNDPHEIEIYNWHTGEFDKIKIRELTSDLLK